MQTNCSSDSGLVPNVDNRFQADNFRASTPDEEAKFLEQQKNNPNLPPSGHYPQNPSHLTF